MACGQSSAEIQKHLVSTSTSYVYEWFTDWMPAIGLDTVRATIKHKAAAAAFQTKFAIQTANVRTNNPNAAATLETSPTAGAGERVAGDTPGNIDITNSTAGTLFVRFGVAYSLSSAGIGDADVSMQLAYDACGRMIGSASAEVLAPDSGNSFLPVTGWMPAIHVSKFKAALVVTGSGSVFKTRMAVQTATTSVESPNAWTTDLDTWRTGDLEVNTGEITPSIGSHMWVRIGVLYIAYSGSNLRAQISCAVGIRK